MLSRKEQELLNSLLAKSKGTKGATPKKVEKQPAPARVKTSAVVTKSAPANDSELTARVDGNCRVRLPKSFFSEKTHRCVVNGETIQQQTENGEWVRGRMTVRSLGAASGDMVEFERVEGKRYEFTAQVVGGSKKPKLRTKAVPAPIQRPVKTTINTKSQPLAKSNGVKVKTAPKVAAHDSETCEIRRCVECAREILAESQAPKSPKKLNRGSASVKQSPRRANHEARAPKASAKLKVGKQVVAPKREAGESKEFQTALGQFRKVVKTNQKNGVVNENPNCTYGPNDGRRFMTRAERKEFNRIATNAGFYGLEGLATAGEMLLA